MSYILLTNIIRLHIVCSLNRIPRGSSTQDVPSRSCLSISSTWLQVCRTWQEQPSKISKELASHEETMSTTREGHREKFLSRHLTVYIFVKNSNARLRISAGLYNRDSFFFFCFLFSFFPLFARYCLLKSRRCTKWCSSAVTLKVYIFIRSIFGITEVMIEKDDISQVENLYFQWNYIFFRNICNWFTFFLIVNLHQIYYLFTTVLYKYTDGTTRSYTSYLWIKINLQNELSINNWIKIKSAEQINKIIQTFYLQILSNVCM